MALTMKEARKEVRELNASVKKVFVDVYEGETYAELMVLDNKLDFHYIQFAEGYDEKAVMKKAKTWATKFDVELEVSNC